MEDPPKNSGGTYLTVWGRDGGCCCGCSSASLGRAVGRFGGQFGKGGKFEGTVWGPGKGKGDFGDHLHAAQLCILLAK